MAAAKRISVATSAGDLRSAAHNEDGKPKRISAI
jgi:hypothetical protein